MDWDFVLVFRGATMLRAESSLRLKCLTLLCAEETAERGREARCFRKSIADDGLKIRLLIIMLFVIFGG